MQIGNRKIEETNLSNKFDSGGSWAPFGRDLGRSGRSFGHFWAVFGRSFGVLNQPFFKHRSKMGSKRPFGAILEGSGRVWGGFWEGLGRILEGWDAGKTKSFQKF